MVSLVFLVTLAGTISIASSIMSSLRLREHQLVSTQHALVKKSEDLEKAYATLTERQRQLVHTEKQASLGQLVAGIAHEINNPIQFIYGNMAILAEAFSDALPLLDEQSATRPDLRIARLDYPFFRKQVPILLTDMANGAARIGAIVRDLKTFARRDEGALDESVDLNDAVQSSLRLLHDVIRHLRVEEDLDPDLPKFRGNLTQLEQVVVNTVQNAAEAIGRDARGGVIRVRTRTEDGGRRVRLSVHDNGAGIPPEVRDRIFDPFFTTKQRSGGTGLGLAITYGIIQQHQGEIQVETPGRRRLGVPLPPPGGPEWSRSMSRILILDDDKAVLNYFEVLLAQARRFEVEALNDSTRAFDTLASREFELLLLDMDMPEVTGMEVLRHVRQHHPGIVVIVITGVGDVELAVEAMKLGAHDYLCKPVDSGRLIACIDRALERTRMREELRAIEAQRGPGLRLGEALKDFVTQDRKLLQTLASVEHIAHSDNNVLICGESGTGKELVARAIHQLGRRADKPFVAVNAAAFASALFDSHFFGHERGAFTGAESAKQGIFEEADGGTLLLDEIGEIELPVQSKLLRVLQSGEYFRLGSTRQRGADVRIIAATNKDLDAAIAEGRFRADLYYRLNISSVFLPPLRERKGDVALLSCYFLDRYCQANGKNDPVHLRAGDGAARRLRLPRQPARAREHHRGRGGARARRHPRPARPAAVPAQGRGGSRVGHPEPRPQGARRDRGGAHPHGDGAHEREPHRRGAHPRNLARRAAREAEAARHRRRVRRACALPRAHRDEPTR